MTAVLAKFNFHFRLCCFSTTIVIQTTLMLCFPQLRPFPLTGLSVRINSPVSFCIISLMLSQLFLGRLDLFGFLCEFCPWHLTLTKIYIYINIQSALGVCMWVCHLQIITLPHYICVEAIDGDLRESHSHIWVCSTAARL